MVSGAALAHLYVFDGSEGLLREIQPQPARWLAIQESWDVFMRCIEMDIPPDLTERDKVIRKDSTWQAAAEAYLDLKRQADSLSALVDEAKETLVGLTCHPSESGAGVTVTRFWKQGNVDYKKVKELKGVDLNSYRVAAREDVRVTVGK